MSQVPGIGRRDALKGALLAPFAGWLGPSGSGPPAATLAPAALLPGRLVRRAEIVRNLYSVQELGPRAVPIHPRDFRTGYVLDDVPAEFAGVSILLAPSGVREFRGDREVARVSTPPEP